MSIREQIKQSTPGPVETIDVPEWGVTVGIRSMSARGRAELNTVLVDSDAPGDDRQLRLWRVLLLGCVVEPDTGQPVFAPDDIDWVFDHDIAVIDRVATACLDASRVGKDGVDEAGKDSSDSATG